MRRQIQTLRVLRRQGSNRVQRRSDTGCVSSTLGRWCSKTSDRFSSSKTTSTNSPERRRHIPYDPHPRRGLSVSYGRIPDSGGIRNDMRRNQNTNRQPRRRTKTKAPFQRRFEPTSMIRRSGTIRFSHDGWLRIVKINPAKPTSWYDCQSPRHVNRSVTMVNERGNPGESYDWARHRRRARP